MNNGNLETELAQKYPPHMVKLLLKCAAHDAMQMRAVVTDVTPAGYGYDEDVPIAHETTEMRAALNAIAEGETILRGKNLSPEKREAIERAVLKARYEAKALSKVGG
ncbi:MAG: hypothetical protein KA763_00475 [Xanthomonadales bacterium]|nr:hypothetical protein [Xanthomonadales bacterium]